MQVDGHTFGEKIAQPRAARANHRARLGQVDDRVMAPGESLGQGGDAGLALAGR
jgi:hypothetical protein